MVDKDLLKDFIDDITWSYSNIKSFGTCKRAWYRHYILGDEGCQNFYSDYGLLAHKMLEEYANGKIQLLDMTQFLEYNWDRYITHEAPLGRNGIDIIDTYYGQLYDFSEQFKGFTDKTIGTELEINIKIGERSFVGYIDRLSQDDDGEYIITDYKSKLKFNNKRELKEYSKQLYLYSTYVYEKYGKFPKQLKFFLFRSNNEVVIEFDKNEYDETIKEICETIDSIYSETDFSCTYSYFYCKHLCEYRYDCTFE